MTRLRTSFVFAAFAFFGLCLAVGSALHPSNDRASTKTPVPEDPILAQVGERSLRVSDLQRAIERQHGLRRDSIQKAELGELLESLVDEELLIQRAEALGLLDTDPGLRQALQLAMKAQALETVPMPSDEQLRLLYEARLHTHGEPTFDQARPRILREQQREARERALAQTLEALRRQTKIERSDIGKAAP